MEPAWVRGVVSGDIDSLDAGEARRLCTGLELDATAVFGRRAAGLDANIPSEASGVVPFDPFIHDRVYPAEALDLPDPPTSTSDPSRGGRVMAMLDGWHRRWLRQQLERESGDDVVFTQVKALDGWSGWVTGEMAASGTVPRGLRRWVHSWHVGWVLGRLDAEVAAGECFWCEEGADIVLRPQ